MQTKSFTATWAEGAGDNAATDPAILTMEDGHRQRRIVIAVADAQYPDGYPMYVPDNDVAAAKAVLDIQAALGRPA